MPPYPIPLRRDVCAAPMSLSMRQARSSVPHDALPRGIMHPVTKVWFLPPGHFRKGKRGPDGLFFPFHCYGIPAEPSIGICVFVRGEKVGILLPREISLPPIGPGCLAGFSTGGLSPCACRPLHTYPSPHIRKALPHSSIARQKTLAKQARNPLIRAPGLFYGLIRCFSLRRGLYTAQRSG